MARRNPSLARVNARLAAIPDAVKKALLPALAKSGDELADTVRGLAPVDQGDLRDSVAVTLPGQQTPPHSQPGGSTVARENQVIVTVGNDAVRYPHLVEHGHLTVDGGHVPAQPFFWPAYRLRKARITGRINRAVTKAAKDNWNK